MHSHPSFLEFLIATRCTLNKLRYREEHKELQRRATQAAKGQINAVLLGGSCKKLYHSSYDSFGPPLALASEHDPTNFITGPDEIKSHTRAYFTTLFAQQDRPPMPKPWLTTPSIVQIRTQTSHDPFHWPQPMSLDDLRLLLRHGKPRPAPGPDGWEKWWVKALHDFSLQLVLDLLNFEISHSHFPDTVKPCTLSTIYKRGPRTMLSNYREVCCSNLLLNMPFTWLNLLLGPYLAKHHILPPGQVATQPGIQGRDLTSFLAQLEAWLNRMHTPLYILCRDQQKGFDHLEPQGFYDAVTAYGLPITLIQFDISAQSDVPYQVKTAHGFTEPLIISDVTKQGGPISPMKSTLMTSLGNHWLKDIFAQHGDGLLIASLQQLAHRPYLPDDRLTLPVNMVEAMDDSAIITTTQGSLERSCLFMERFQAAYGWFTNWVKSLLILLNILNAPPLMRMPSISPDDPASSTLIWHDVQVTTSHIEFLRVSINNPQHQFEKLRDIILSFDLPNLSLRLPLTVLRRIFAQCLISRLRPHLAFQPISRSHAMELDHLLALRVHQYFSFPFRFNAILLSLPIQHYVYGFDFPSINRLNDCAVVSGLWRDLNHHNPAFHDMAHITLADWTCSINHCVFPLHPISQESYACQTHHLPPSWITAHTVLSTLRLSIRQTDLSYLFSGDVSLCHLLRSLPPLPDHPMPSPQMITNLERAGFTHLHHLVTWFPSNDPLAPPSWSLHPTASVSNMLRFTAAASDWPAVSGWLQSLSLPYLVAGQGSSGAVSRSTRDSNGSTGDLSVTRDWTLALPRDLRRTLAEQVILTLLHSSHLPLFPSTSPTCASDGSMTPAAALFRQFRSVTFAVSTPTASLACSLSSFGLSASILHAEVYGIVVSSLSACSAPSPSPPSSLLPLYTDHLNSVRLINDSISTSSPPPLISGPGSPRVLSIGGYNSSSPLPLITLFKSTTHLHTPPPTLFHHV
ncbi:hypothetical protein SCP_0300210 [Sparassis crispa]|uniref:Uncharacterized protein n=1 Tax=Sparassis crispa TaxID=139825 RepID=A0A401GDQ4_9APHY|nr:hypothetical protein SCP_0300210 [Sparassis crispa]GBE80306.1 hypothetical protein SCP_0300210 [Sparassis crispa]